MAVSELQITENSTNFYGIISVAYTSGYAYVASIDADSLVIIDVRDAAVPVLTSVLKDSTRLNGIIDLKIKGDLMLRSSLVIFMTPLTESALNPVL